MRSHRPLVKALARRKTGWREGARWLGWALACVGAWVGSSGCGNALVEGQLRDLRAKLEATERLQSETVRKLDDLDNRVFLLSDQVESQKVALSRHGGEPRLPIVTLAPTRGPGGGAELPAPNQPEPGDDEHASVTITGRTHGLSPTDDGLGRRAQTLAGTTTPWLLPSAEQENTEPEEAAARANGSEPDRGASEAASPAAGNANRGAGARPLPPGVISFGVAKVASGREAPVARVEIKSARAPRPVTAPVDPTALYRAAYEKLKAGQVEVAADEFRAFVLRFPAHDLADNAQYWLGETFYARQSYQEAAQEFRAVVRRWPSGNKAPDALLKLGYCMLALGDFDAGRAALAEVADHYPRTEVAHTASKRLAELPEKKP